MAYSQAYDKDAAWVRDVALGTMKRGMRTIVGVHAYEGGSGAPLQADIAAVQEIPVEGVCLFREGACVLAFEEDKAIAVYNPLGEAVTRIEARCGKDSAAIDCCILHGEEKTLALPFAPTSLRAFTGEKEVCIYLHA